ncbi:MAG: ribonuclease domain-containing protein [Candidatus Limnocylindrales bacterium]
MRLLVPALSVLALGALVLIGCATRATVGEMSVDPASGLPVVALADLPPEARQTLEHIQSGGPLPYRQDGAVFENREGRLPTRESGYYREYTVPTPGADDRGARRIVLGGDGDMYWTSDHYDSFAWIDP